MKEASEPSERDLDGALRRRVEETRLRPERLDALVREARALAREHLTNVFRVPRPPSEEKAMATEAPRPTFNLRDQERVREIFDAALSAADGSGVEGDLRLPADEPPTLDLHLSIGLVAYRLELRPAGEPDPSSRLHAFTDERVRRFRRAAEEGRFQGQPIKDLPRRDLYAIIGYLSEELHRAQVRLELT